MSYLDFSLNLLFSVLAESKMADKDEHLGNARVSEESSSTDDEATDSNINRRRRNRNTEYKTLEGGSSLVPPSIWDKKCSICEKEFANKTRRDRHVREVHQQKKVECPDCDETFSKRENLLRHRAAAHNTKAPSFKCDICDKSFSRHDNLVTHQRVHSGEKFRCPVCPAKYTQKGKLNKHIQVGKHLLIFYCEICKQRMNFTCMSILEKHVKASWVERGYGVKLTCDGSSGRYIEKRGESREKEEEKKLLIERGLKRAQEEYNG